MGLRQNSGRDCQADAIRRDICSDLVIATAASLEDKEVPVMIIRVTPFSCEDAMLRMLAAEDYITRHAQQHPQDKDTTRR